MALSVVNRTAVIQTSGSTQSVTVSPSSGNLLVVGVQAQSPGGSVTVADAGPNTYAALSSNPVNNNGGINYEYLFYAKNIVGFTSGLITVTIGGGGANYFTIVAYEIAGADLTSPLVTEGTGAGSGDVTTGTITLGGENCIIIAQLEADQGPFGYTPANGETGFVQDSAGYIRDQYLIGASNTATGGTLTFSGAFGIIAGVFREAGGGGGGGSILKHMLQHEHMSARSFRRSRRDAQQRFMATIDRQSRKAA